MENYSVLMGIYKGTNVMYLRKSIDSMLNQTVVKNDYVIVLDGEVTNEIDNLLNDLILHNPGLFHLVRLLENRGLGVALRTGVEQCKNRLVARMDDDDISYPKRCELQLLEFEASPNLELVGGYIDEFHENETCVIACRRVPLEHDEILSYARRRSPFNHVSVMFDKNSVIKHGNYSELRLCQDVELWQRMLHGNSKMKNIPISLILVRFDETTYKRRKNRNNIDTMTNIWRRLYTEGYCKLNDYVFVTFSQRIIGCLPICLIKKLYSFTRREPDPLRVRAV